MKTDLITNVKKLLQRFSFTRDDDFMLYAYYCYYFCDKELWGMKFGDVMMHHKRLNMPSYESVTRARRKVQEECEELRGKGYKRRKEKQEEYREEYRKV